MNGPFSAPPPLDGPAFDGLMAPFKVEAGAHVAVAVSGGADSLCLAVLLADWARARGVRLTALTVDHRLRKAARAEAEQVGAWLADLGVSHDILTWNEGADTSSAVQARARDARYGLLTDWCRAHDAKHLCIAHHAGDQAETFVMRLKRGSTLFGLAAMADRRDLDGVVLCRPFLKVSKARLEATLCARGLAWIEDPSNADTAFERVRTRALIRALAADGVTAERLTGAARAARRVTDVLDRAVAAFCGQSVRQRATGGVEIDAPAFAALPGPVAERALSGLLRGVDGRVYPASPAKVARLCRWLSGRLERRETGARTLGGCLVRVRAGTICVTIAPPRRDTVRPTVFRRGVFSPPALAPGGQKPYISGVERTSAARCFSAENGELTTKC